MSDLTHFDQKGCAHMVNVGDKIPTKRIAIAGGTIFMGVEAFRLLSEGGSKKGDVIGVARIATIQATKQTATLIPLCHPIPLTHVSVDFELSHEKHSVSIVVRTETIGNTGVEMEALTGASIGLLTIYDMLKAIDKGMHIEHVRLIEKHGGKSGAFISK